MDKRITEFYNLLLENQDEMTVLEEKLSKISSEEDFKELVARDIIPMAKAKGFDFTEEDLLNYEKEMLEKLSEEELVGVSGGVSLMNKRVLSLFLAGISLSSNIQSTQAVVERDIIMKSPEKIVSDNPAGRSQQEDTGEETRQQETTSKMSAEQVRKVQSQQLKSVETETRKAGVDVPYMLDALNLVDPYIFNLTGTTENFRFFDGYKQTISTQTIIAATDGIPGWDYNKDEGKGSPNFMRCLFPSSAGRLSVAGGFWGLENFSDDCEPTPELIAQIIGCIHNYIRDEDESTTNDLDSLMEAVKKDFAKNEKNPKLSENTTKSAKKFLTDKLQMSEFRNFSGRHKANKEAKYIRTILYLLQSAKTMIKEQESDEKDPEKILPKYMPERMLMSYFILNFNKEEEVNDFYTEAKRVIKTKSNVDQSEIDRSKARLDKVIELLGRVKRNKDKPYREELQEQGAARLVTKDDNSGKVKFSNDTFSDCADIAVRHIINLLSYNEKDQDHWKFILDKEDQGLEQECQYMLDKMQKGGEFEFKSLKNRLKLFFYYQSRHWKGADAADKETRSLWNYVISNMDKDVEEGMYTLRYKQNENELEPGCLNMLKSIYNMVFALKPENTESNTKLKEARESISELESAISGGEVYEKLNEYLCTAIEKTFGLIKKIQVKKVDISENNVIDCFGTVEFNDFAIYQRSGHAYVNFIPASIESSIEYFKNDDPLKEFLKEDSTAQLLSNMFECRLEDSKVSAFNSLFCLDEETRDYDNMFFKNFETLKFLKEAQDKGDNEYVTMNLMNSCCGLSNIKIFDESGKDVIPLPVFIFKNYVKGYGHFEKLEPHRTLNEIFKDYQGDDICEKDGVKFYFKVNDDGKITIYPLVESNVKDLKIPSRISVGEKNYDVSKIGLCAFLNNKTLETVTIEDGIEDLTIENCAFKGSSVQEIKVLSRNLQRLIIEEFAFENTQSLKVLSVPDNIKELRINKRMLKGSGMRFFKIPNNIGSLVISDVFWADIDSSMDFNMPDNVQELVIDKTLMRGSDVKEFKFPANLKKLTIKNKAFADTESLKEFIIPASVEELEIEEEAFKGSNIEKFEVLGNLRKMKIGKSVFADTKSLREFNLSASIEVEVEGDPFMRSDIRIRNIPAVIREKIK